MALSDDEIIHVAEIVRQQNGKHITADKVIPVVSAIFVMTGIIGGWLWFGGGLSTKVTDHTAAIQKLTEIVDAVKDDTRKTSAGLAVIQETVSRIDRGLIDARTDRINRDSEVDKKLDKIGDQLRRDEEDGILKRDGHR
jgi:uncharacterized phage infection (PIP) family protein YhgE